MPLGNDMTSEEVKTLILRAKAGDNAAWESLYHQFENYVHSHAWNHLNKLDMESDRKKDLEEELSQAGWQGFLSAVPNYDPKQGEFLTYATGFIDGEIKKELKEIKKEERNFAFCSLFGY